MILASNERKPEGEEMTPFSTLNFVHCNIFTIYYLHATQQRDRFQFRAWRIIHYHKRFRCFWREIVLVSKFWNSSALEIISSVLNLKFSSGFEIVLIIFEIFEKFYHIKIRKSRQASDHIACLFAIVVALFLPSSIHMKHSKEIGCHSGLGDLSKHKDRQQKWKCWASILSYFSIWWWHNC